MKSDVKLRVNEGVADSVWNTCAEFDVDVLCNSANHILTEMLLLKIFLERYSIFIGDSLVQYLERM